VTTFGMGLFPQHQELLAASAVSPEVARSRGYRSVDTKSRLRDLGFGEAQCRTPGLLIPVYDTAGQLALHQYRPDDPRVIDGKPVKYETPIRYRLVVDVHPLINGALRTPRAPLVITEGSRKVDALVSAGLTAIGLLGVSGWRSGGAALPDLLDIFWPGRRVIVAFDSDVMTKASVRQELFGLTRYLAGKGAEVEWLTLPQNPHYPQKCGVDDWIAEGHTGAELLNLAEPPDLDPPPVPLIETGPLPEFPVKAMPTPVAEMVTAVAEFTQTDRGMAGTTAVTMLAAAAGGRVEIEVRPGWREPLCLYTVTVAQPGERKSAVQAVMIRPLIDAEAELVRRGEAARREAETTRAVAEKAAEQARKAAGRAEGAQRDERLAEAIAAAEAAMSQQVPAVPRLLADDVTPEATASLLAEQGGRLAIVSAEGGVFDTLAGRYSNGIPSLDVFLKGHAGDPLRVDRKGRDPEHVARPALTLALMVQPAVLEAIARHDVFRGRGLLARFLYAIPPSRVGRRTVGAPSVPEDVSTAYHELVRGLALNLADWTDPAILRLTPDAGQAVLDLERRVEPTLGPDGELRHMADWGSKFVGATVRIAGLLHLAEHPDDGFRRAVGVGTVRNAIRVGDFFLEHAVAAFDAMRTDPAKADAHVLLDVLRRLRHDIVSRRDIFTAASRARFPKADELDPGLRVLEDHGYLSRLPEPKRDGPGRRASAAWAVHPSVLAAETAETAERPAGSNSADSAVSAAPPASDT
jgi:hypothetical protein